MHSLALPDPLIPSNVHCRNSDLLNDIREYQRKVKDLKSQLERVEGAELEARGSAHEARQALEHVEATFRDQGASSKAAIGNFQIEIKSLKTR